MRTILLAAFLGAAAWAQTTPPPAVKAPAKSPRELAMEVIDQGKAEANPLKHKQFLVCMEAAGTNRATVAILDDALLNGKQPEVRQAAAATLGDIKSKTSIPKLKKALEDESPDVSFTAAHALWRLGDPTGREIFEAVLAGERSDNPGLIKGSLRDARNRLYNPKGLALMGIKEGVGMFLGPAAMGITVFEELRKDAGASARVLSASILA